MRLTPLRKDSQTVSADRRKHHEALYLHPAHRETEMLVSLTFSQVREAGLFAWREDHLLYTPTLDAILTVSPCDGSWQDAGAHLDVRTSSLRGDEPDARIGWHHLRECRCVYCRESRLQLMHDDA